MKYIEIKIFGEEDRHLKGMIDIESEELCITYGDTGTGHHGLQCAFESDTKKYHEVLNLVGNIACQVKQLNQFMENHKDMEG